MTGLFGREIHDVTAAVIRAMTACGWEGYADPDRSGHVRYLYRTETGVQAVADFTNDGLERTIVFTFANFDSFTGERRDEAVEMRLRPNATHMSTCITVSGDRNDYFWGLFGRIFATHSLWGAWSQPLRECAEPLGL